MEISYHAVIRQCAGLVKLSEVVYNARATHIPFVPFGGECASILPGNIQIEAVCVSPK